MARLEIERLCEESGAPAPSASLAQGGFSATVVATIAARLASVRAGVVPDSQDSAALLGLG